MKRYLTFCGGDYYPGGGWDDLAGESDEIDQNLINQVIATTFDDGDWYGDFDWLQIVDTQTGKRVSEDIEKQVKNQIDQYVEQKKKEKDEKDHPGIPSSTPELIAICNYCNWNTSGSYKTVREAFDLAKKHEQETGHYHVEAAITEKYPIQSMTYVKWEDELMKND